MECTSWARPMEEQELLSFLFRGGRSYVQFHMNHISPQKISPGVICTVTHYTGHILANIYHASWAVLGWPGDGDCFFMWKKNGVRWLALSKRLVEVASFPDPTQLSITCSMAARWNLGVAWGRGYGRSSSKLQEVWGLRIVQSDINLCLYTLLGTHNLAGIPENKVHIM